MFGDIIPFPSEHLSAQIGPVLAILSTAKTATFYYFEERKKKLDFNFFLLLLKIIIKLKLWWKPYGQFYGITHAPAKKNL